jgi:hypothetical protein
VAAEKTDAKKVRLAAEGALEVARRAKQVVVARGAKASTLATQGADDETLLAALLGPTGRLRASTILKGNTLFVGFSEAAYQGLLK